MSRSLTPQRWVTRCRPIAPRSSAQPRRLQPCDVSRRDLSIRGIRPLRRTRRSTHIHRTERHGQPADCSRTVARVAGRWDGFRRLAWPGHRGPRCRLPAVAGRPSRASSLARAGWDDRCRPFLSAGPPRVVRRRTLDYRGVRALSGVGPRLAATSVLVIPHPAHPYWDAVLPIKMFDYLAAGLTGRCDPEVGDGVTSGRLRGRGRGRW